MSVVSFTLRQDWSVGADTLWTALADWESHAGWIPATTVRILDGDGGLGTRFVARTGIGPLAFDDNMTVIEFDAATTHAVVRKTGPVLKGSAGFRIEPLGAGCHLIWFETVHVPLLPRFLAPAVARIGRLLFEVSLRQLRKHLASAQ